MLGSRYVTIPNKGKLLIIRTAAFDTCPSRVKGDGGCGGGLIYLPSEELNNEKNRRNEKGTKQYK